MSEWTTPPPFGRWWIVVNLALATAWVVFIVGNSVGSGSSWRSVLWAFLAVFAVERAWRLGRPRTRLGQDGIRTRTGLRMRLVPWDQVAGDTQYEVFREGVTVLLTDDSRLVLPDTTREHEGEVAAVVEQHSSRTDD